MQVPWAFVGSYAEKLGKSVAGLPLQAAGTTRIARNETAAGSVLTASQSIFWLAS